MAIYLGSTEVTDIYLGESGYGLANVVRVYLDSTIVWPFADMVVSGITDGNATAMNGDYTLYPVSVNGKNTYYGPNISGTPPSNLSGKTVCLWTGSQWLLGFEGSGGLGTVDLGYYWYASGTASLSPPTTGWTGSSLTGSVTVVVNN